MPDHKISADGQRIECHAAPNAKCRQRVECDSEAWSYTDGCSDHTPPHPIVLGECWMLPWLNAPGIAETYWDGGGYMLPGEVKPGLPVELDVDMPDAITWKYEESTDA